MRPRFLPSPPMKRAVTLYVAYSASPFQLRRGRILMHRGAELGPYRCKKISRVSCFPDGNNRIRSGTEKHIGCYVAAPVQCARRVAAWANPSIHSWVGVEHCVGLRLGQLLSGFPFCVSWLRIRAHRRELSRAASATGAADANLRVVRLCNKHHIRDADLSDQRRNGCQRDAAIQARS